MPNQPDHAAGESRPQRTSPLAIVSFACCLFGPLGAFPAIVCGHLARSACRQDPRISGAGLALTGLLIGYAFVILSAVVGAVLLFAPLGASTSNGPFIYELN